jgi:TnpA family transposase
VRRRFLTAEVARSFAIEIANATFASRDPAIWGETSTTVASDSKHIGTLDQNILTEWHARYRNPGVLIYLHVEKKSLATHSQLTSCSASEVAAMIDGAMRHGTSLDVEGNYTDSHGQSQIAFGLTRLRGSSCCRGSSRSTAPSCIRPIQATAACIPASCRRSPGRSAGSGSQSSTTR